MIPYVFTLVTCLCLLWVSVKHRIPSVIFRLPDRKRTDRSGNDAVHVTCAADGSPGATTTPKTLTVSNIIGSKKGVSFAIQALGQLVTRRPLDDKKLLLEQGVSLLQSLPRDSRLSSYISDGFIQMLYRDLPHPSTTLAGPTTRYRRHDGGNNNIWNPEMGKAGSPYARNVPPERPKSHCLPDPELVWEKLLKRPEGCFREHPSGLNRLFFSFATIVIHECFQTNRTNQWINETSSYVDLSTLYGNSEDEQPRVRTYVNGTIYPDSIASDRIMLMPPGVVALLIMFSRNHNCIAGNLLSINEENKYGDWHSLANEKQIWQDNDIFQLARNINVGFFATVVLKDYVAAILNTPRADSTWSLDLGKEIKSHKQRVERGAGNVVSVEFAVLYHWHAALSAADANWMEDLIRSHLPHLESIDDMTPPMFGRVVAAENEKLKAVPPREWTFYNLKRGPNGRFDDIELSGLIKDCIEEPAHAFGPHGTPASLKVVDILGQLQAREIFNVCTLNEFRSYLNLRPYETFEEWCEDKDTARVAELLYSHIDNMELYPGLMAECTKPAMAGSGVCPGQTTGRGILDDAVALVRGDRFLSYDFNSTTLTNWGASKLGDLPGGAYGGMLPKLLFDGLPYSFTGTSTYALLPFYTPKAIRDILQKNNVLQMYDSARPIVDTRPSVVYTAEACRRLLTDRDHFSSLYVDSDLIESLFYEDRFEKHVFEFFDKTVVKNIKDNTLKYGGDRYAIDIVHHVANITPILWLADRYSLPVKCDSNPKGTFTANDVGRMLKTVAIYRNLNLDPSIEWKLREEAQTSEHILRQMFESLLKRHSNNRDLGKRSSLYGPSDSTTTGPEAERFYSALVATRRPYADLIEQCIGQASMLANMLTNQAALLVDLFLTPGYENYLCRMIELAKMDDDEMAVKELQGFVYEGMRHTGVNLAVTRVTSKDTIIQDRVQGPVELHEGQKVIAATAVAAMDPIAFSMPEELNPRRPQENYRSLLGSPLLRIAGPAIAAILKGIFRLKNVRRARGKLGQLCIVEKELIGINMRAYLDSNTKESLWPTNLMLEYEDGLHGGLY